MTVEDQLAELGVSVGLSDVSERWRSDSAGFSAGPPPAVLFTRGDAEHRAGTRARGTTAPLRVPLAPPL